MATRVFKVDELAAQIATHLLAISPKSTVALAMTCRAIEVPALRTLWETRASLSFLFMRILPTSAWGFNFLRQTDYDDDDPDAGYDDLCLLSLRRPLTRRELTRLKRYMSWMRRFEVREWGLSDEITQLILPPSDGIPPLLPLYLRELDWWLNETNLPFLLKFLSPELTKIKINTNAPVGPTETFKPWDEIPDEVFTIIRSAIKMFPSSGLQKLDVILGVGPKTDLTEEISAFILEHGEALRDLCTNSVLSTQAIVHLMKLPHFSSWVTEQGPPSVTELIHHGVPDGAASLFPSLGMLNFMSEAAFVGWLSLFEAAKSRTPPWTITGDGLPGLSYGNSILPVDSTLIFRLLPHGSLVDVKIGLNCSPFRPCASRFTDQDAERLAIALPKLEALSLGERPCRADTCPTTIRSLLSFSIHCPKLRYLSIHFRTANLRADMLDLLSYAYTQGLHLRPKCVLNGLMIGEMRGDFADSDPGLISIGMLMIFPSLAKFGTRSPAWGRLELLVNTLRQTEGTAHLTEKLMMYISRARELARDGTPGRSAEEVANILCKPFSMM